MATQVVGKIESEPRTLVSVFSGIEEDAKQALQEDRLDVREAERRLADPTEVPIPYEQARKELGLA